MAERRAGAELASEREQEKARELDKAPPELRDTHEHADRDGEAGGGGPAGGRVGHELRNPLAAVRNAHASPAPAAGPAETWPATRASPFLAHHRPGAEDLLGIISDLLDYARGPAR